MDVRMDSASNRGRSKALIASFIESRAAYKQAQIAMNRVPDDQTLPGLDSDDDFYSVNGEFSRSSSRNGSPALVESSYNKQLPHPTESYSNWLTIHETSYSTQETHPTETYNKCPGAHRTESYSHSPVIHETSDSTQGSHPTEISKVPGNHPTVSYNHSPAIRKPSDSIQEPHPTESYNKWAGINETRDSKQESHLTESYNKWPATSKITDSEQDPHTTKKCNASLEIIEITESKPNPQPAEEKTKLFEYFLDHLSSDRVGDPLLNDNKTRKLVEFFPVSYWDEEVSFSHNTPKTTTGLNTKPVANHPESPPEQGNPRTPRKNSRISNKKTHGKGNLVCCFAGGASPIYELTERDQTPESTPRRVEKVRPWIVVLASMLLKTKRRTRPRYK